MRRYTDFFCYLLYFMHYSLAYGMDMHRIMIMNMVTSLNSKMYTYNINAEIIILSFPRIYEWEKMEIEVRRCQPPPFALPHITNERHHH